MALTAIVIGATGLVGSALVQQLLHDERFSLVKIFVRRSLENPHPKLEEHIINFENLNEWHHLLTGDVLFSALGTTLKQAGSKEAQYKIDHTYQFEAAKAAAQNGVPVYVLVSSAMANVDSKIFYTRMKGELERDIKKLSFAFIHILQPGMLVGDRKNERMGEKIGISIVRFLNKIGIAKKQKPVHAEIVAKAMINLSFKKSNTVTSLLNVFKEAGE